MTRFYLSVAALAIVAACSGGNPFEDNAEEPSGGGETPTTGTPTTGTPITGEGLPPGTTSPTAELGIFRSEARSEEDATNGNGFANEIRYNAANDTFEVNNLAFDGGNVYQRGNPVGSLGPYSVYEADQQFPDSVTADPINQFTHRAIYGVSRDSNAAGVPNTRFAIVRTGAYVPYGFGGFIYQREGGVTLPETGQAQFRGKTAGLRDFDGADGLQYSTSDIEIAVDFNDFDQVTGGRGDGVKGTLSNRRVFDINGNDITSQVVGNINSENTASLSSLPNAFFTVGPNVLDNNGEIVGELTSTFVNDQNVAVNYEEGKYYAIISGDTPNEIVGILVTTNTAEFQGVTVRDTSGFIVYRDTAQLP